MKVNLMCFVGEDRPQGVIVKAIASDEVDIYVSSDDLTDAMAKIQEGQGQVEAALAEWTPEKEEAKRQEEEAQKQQKHYHVQGQAIEDMAADREAFENSNRGRKFIKQIANACIFREKYGKHGGIRMQEALYLANRHRDSLLDGFCDVYALAFRHGFKACKKELMKKTGGTK